MRFFQPDINLEVVKVRPTPRRHKSSLRDYARLIMSLLQEAGEALGHRETTGAGRAGVGTQCGWQGAGGNDTRPGGVRCGMRSRETLVSGELRRPGAVTSLAITPQSFW
jgi:hypothetical protein